MKIEITEQDITNGKPDHNSQCPIALAVCRALEITDCELVEVDRDSVFFYGDDIAGSVSLPPKAQSFIAAFDAGQEVKPFSFKLNVPAN